jgi:hypothetical protein
MNVDHSHRHIKDSSSISAIGYQSDPALQLVIQIQSLVNNPGFILQIPGRSPLFQIAEHLAVPASTTQSNSKPAVTDKIFADVRQEALKSGLKKGSVRTKIANRKSNSNPRFQC